MAVEDSTTELIGVAHGNTLLDVFEDMDRFDRAQRQVQHYTDTAAAIGVSAKYDIVSVTRTVTYSKPKRYVAPSDEDDGGDGEAAHESEA